MGQSPLAEVRYWSPRAESRSKVQVWGQEGPGSVLGPLPARTGGLAATNGPGPVSYAEPRAVFLTTKQARHFDSGRTRLGLSFFTKNRGGGSPNAVRYSVPTSNPKSSSLEVL